MPCRAVFLFIYIVTASRVGNPKNNSRNFDPRDAVGDIREAENSTSMEPFLIMKPTTPSFATSVSTSKRKRTLLSGKNKAGRGRIFVFRPYNFTVERISQDAVKIGWQRNLKKTPGPKTTFSIKVQPYRTRQYFEAQVTDRTSNIILHGLSPDTQYNLVVTQDEDILLNKSIVVGHSSAQPKKPTTQPTNSTLYYHPTPPTKIQVEEIAIVSFILVLWVCAIILFIHRWGKIRMLVPHQPPYAEEAPSEQPQSKVLMNGSRVNLASLDPNHPNFTSACSSSNYSTTAAVLAGGIGTQIGMFGASARHNSNNSNSSVILAGDRARLWRLRAQQSQGGYPYHHHPNNFRQSSVLSENPNQSSLHLPDIHASRRVQSALDLRETCSKRPVGNFHLSNSNHFNQAKLSVQPRLKNSHLETDGDAKHEKKQDETKKNASSTIVLVSGVNSDIKMSVLNNNFPMDKNYDNTKDTQV